MLPDWILPALAALNLLLLAVLLLRRPAPPPDIERLERELRDEVARSGSATRQEFGQLLSGFQRNLLAQSGDAVRTQHEHIDAFRAELASLQVTLSQQAQAASAAQESALARQAEHQANALKRLG